MVASSIIAMSHRLDHKKHPQRADGGGEGGVEACFKFDGAIMAASRFEIVLC